MKTRKLNQINLLQ